MTTEELVTHEQMIREMVGRHYEDATGKAKPIYDGVVDPASYLAAPVRVLWILKEPWDGPDSSGGGWSLTHDLLNNKPAVMAKSPTFQPIIYVTFGILNRVWRRTDMPYIRQRPDLALVLRSIAFLNVKKLPGLTRANNKEVFDAYLKHRTIILTQIRCYQPQIIIGCQPHMPQIMADLGAPKEKIVAHKSTHVAKLNDCVMFSVYHPSQTKIKREQYVNDILESVANR